MPSPPAPDPGDTRVPRAPAPKTFASDRYVVRRVLPEGGQKVVYLVHDEALKSFTDATVAVFPSLTTNALTDGPSCIRALRLAFLRKPETKLDVDGCIAKVPPIAFAGT